MNNTRFVGLHDLPGQQNTVGDVLGHLACHIVTLHRIDGGILVSVLLLDLFVVALDQAQNTVIRCIGLTEQAADIPVSNIDLGNLECAMGHDGLFYQILDLLHRGATTHFLTADLDAFGNAADLQRSHADLLVGGLVGLCNSVYDLFNVKNGFRTVTLDNFHSVSPP